MATEIDAIIARRRLVSTATCYLDFREVKREAVLQASDEDLRALIAAVGRILSSAAKTEAA